MINTLKKINDKKGTLFVFDLVLITNTRDSKVYNFKQVNDI